MANIIRTVIAFRRAHTDEWLQYKDVVPAAGEPCYDLDLHTLKVGDGVLTYENLPVIGGVDVKVEADGKSIVLEDGIFKLAGFDAADVGAQPRKNAEGKIEWVVPSTKDLDDLKSAVSGLQKDVKVAQTDIADLKALVGSADEGSGTLLSRIEGLEDKMDGTGEGTVDAKIDAKINAWAKTVTDNGTIDTVQELINYVANHGGEVEAIVADIVDLQGKVGEDPVGVQIANAIKNSGHITKAEAEDTLLSIVEANAVYDKVKYEIINTPVGTLVDYRDKEIRVMVPSGADYAKQNVGTGGDANTYYVTFKTYAPNDAVGYIEHIGNQVDDKVLTDIKVDAYGRKYQPTWLGIARYDEVSGWTYYGKNSTANKYIGWDYQIDWYDANGVVIASDKIRINLSNEACHNVVEPYYMAGTIKGVKLNGTLLDAIDGIVNVKVPEIKGSDEIAVSEDGTLSIKAISWDKIAHGESELVLDGGGAASR